MSRISADVFFFFFVGTTLTTVASVFSKYSLRREKPKVLSFSFVCAKRHLRAHDRSLVECTLTH